MSSISSAELTMIDEVLRGESKGYILDFSNRTMGEFFVLEFDVDILSDDYARDGTSKANRLRSFLKQIDDASAARVLRRFHDYREAMPDQLKSNIRPLGEAQLLALIGRLERGGESAGIQPKPIFNRLRYEQLRDELNTLWDLEARARGYAFESYLKNLFDTFHLSARAPFILIGEQIDGSFQLGHETYLLEAKWQKDPIGVLELHGFHGKVEQKASWARGLFVSFGGFTHVGLEAFGRAKRVICMDGRDIFEALDRNIPVDAVLDRKVRYAAETGRPFAPVSLLFPSTAACS